MVKILQEVDSSKPVVIAEREYGGMTLNELRRLKAVEEENTRLRRIAAQQAIDIDLLKEGDSKNW